MESCDDGLQNITIVIIAIAILLFLALTRASAALPATLWELYGLSSRKPSCVSNQLQGNLLVIKISKNVQNIVGHLVLTPKVVDRDISRFESNV